MTYTEWKNLYKWIIKKAPDITSLYGVENACIKLTETRYAKRGGRWIETETKAENITPEYYLNTVDAVPFFKGLGGRERLVTSYTKFGLIPVEVQSTSPDGKTKTVRRFTF